MSPSPASLSLVPLIQPPLSSLCPQAALPGSAPVRGDSPLLRSDSPRGRAWGRDLGTGGLLRKSPWEVPLRGGKGVPAGQSQPPPHLEQQQSGEYTADFVWPHALHWSVTACGWGQGGPGGPSSSLGGGGGGEGWGASLGRSRKGRAWQQSLQGPPLL